MSIPVFFFAIISTKLFFQVFDNGIFDVLTPSHNIQVLCFTAICFGFNSEWISKPLRNFNTLYTKCLNKKLLLHFLYIFQKIFLLFLNCNYFQSAKQNWHNNLTSHSVWYKNILLLQMLSYFQKYADVQKNIIRKTCL